MLLLPGRPLTARNASPLDVAGASLLSPPASRLPTKDRQDAVHLTVCTVSGEALQLELKRDSDVLSAKLALRRKLQIPHACQKLLLGANVLQDSDSLASLAKGQPVSLTLVVTTASLFAELEGGTPYIQTRALSDFRKLGLKAGDDAVSAVVARFADESSEVRDAAVHTLSKVACPGDEKATSAVVARLESDSWECRVTALEGLVRVGERGSPQVVSAAAACLEDDNWKVRFAATEALQRVADRGDAGAVAAVCRRLTHRSWEVRQSALEALLLVAKRGDRPGVIAVLRLLEEPETSAKVRRAAAKALGSLAEPGNVQVLAALTSLVAEESWEVRWEACEALGCAAERGDLEVIAKVTSLLQDPDADVRRSAVETLRLLHPKRRGSTSSRRPRRGSG